MMMMMMMITIIIIIMIIIIIYHQDPHHHYCHHNLNKKVFFNLLFHHHKHLNKTFFGPAPRIFPAPSPPPFPPDDNYFLTNTKFNKIVIEKPEKVIENIDNALNEIHQMIHQKQNLVICYQMFYQRRPTISYKTTE